MKPYSNLKESEDIIRQIKYKRLNLDKNNFDKNDNYILYHGTSKIKAKKIKKEGFKITYSGTGTGAERFTTSTKKEVAADFVRGDNEGEILKIKIPRDKLVDFLWPGYDNNYKGSGDKQYAIKKNIPPKYIYKS